MTSARDEKVFAELHASLEGLSADGARGCVTRAGARDAAGRTTRAATVNPGTPGIGACAIRILLGRARAEGLDALTHIVGHAGTDRPVLCGLCRQVLAELEQGGE